MIYADYYQLELRYIHRHWDFLYISQNEGKEETETNEHFLFLFSKRGKQQGGAPKVT